MVKAKLKTTQNEGSVEAFLNAVEDERQRSESFRVLEILTRGSGEVPRMWGGAIIGFGNHTLKYDSGRELDWMMIGFSPRKGKFAFYLAKDYPGYDDLMSGLGKHQMSKGCLYIKRLADVDEAVLEKLAAHSVEHLKGV